MVRAEAVTGHILTVFFTAVLAVIGSTGHIPCKSSELVVYKVIFTTNWTRDQFPKQYPEFRPPAQWSRVVGISHNAHYRLFQLGAQASSELKQFAETGKQELLGNDRALDHILDEFLLPAIKNGSGRVTADFIVDANHTKVSLVSRIVPSPDWFVGIDSLDLCADGHWVDSVTAEASPLDAGTDSGFTFTAPNWATVPQEAMYKITAQYPRHLANSFYYPNLKDLPPIATFQIFKKRSYEMHSIPRDSEHTNIIQNGINFPVDSSEENSGIKQNEVMPWKHIKKKARKKKRSKNHKIAKKCEVGEWSKWSTCNGPCGQSLRTRNVTRMGQFCPPLLQERTCGCTKYIFNW